MINKAKLMPDDATAQALSQIGPMLKTGAIASELTGGWALWGDLPKEFKFSACINPTGGVDGSGTTAEQCWCEPLELCSKTKHPDEAWQFVKWCTDDEESIAIQLTNRNLVPAKKKFLDKFVDLVSDKMDMPKQDQKVFYAGGLEQAETTVPCHILVGWAGVRDIMYNELGPIWKGETTAKQAVEDQGQVR